MNNRGTSLKFGKKYRTILELLLFLGFICGYIIYRKSNNAIIINDLQNINEFFSLNKINFVLDHFMTVSTLLVLSMSIVGIVGFYFYFVYETSCIFYSIFVLIKVFKFRGLILGIIYNIFLKLIFLGLLFIILKKTWKILKMVIILIKKKEVTNFQYSFFKNIKGILICLGLMVLNDILIYLFLNKIMNCLTFIVK